MNTLHLHGSTRNAGPLSRQGFTLTEMLVAVGAMALLALGVAEVFSLTTRTVSAGRRISNLNAVASATERQMRADFAAITSRGPMVIRNQLANNGQPVEAYPGDPAARTRRIDEILFFATGHYTSQQQPVTADGLPVGGSAAMIYYGHGVRQNPLAPTSSGFTNPVSITDTNAAAPALGANPGPGGSKVNQYSADWTLVRRAFVLTPPAPQIGHALPAGQGFGAVTATADSACEINGLPAVPSPSWTDAQAWSSGSMTYPRLRGNVIPALSSGVVDIIAMDLRSVSAQLGYTYNAPNNLGDSSSLLTASNQIAVGTTGAAAAAAQQRWMRTLLPADSDNNRRIRVEPSAPDFLNLNGGAPNAVQRADQLMLSSGAFLPRCSEFIVEYSFGRARTLSAGVIGGGSDGYAGPTPADVGAVYWHGLKRMNGPNNNGTVNYGRDTVRYEDWVAANNNVPHFQTVRRRDRSLLPAFDRNATRDVPVRHDLIDPRNVQAWGGNSNWAVSGNSSYAFFGLVDPYYFPLTTLPLVKDKNANGQFDWADGDILQEPESLPWARPTMVRITFTLADPTDPSIEQTFQFVFDLPKDVRASEM